MAPHSQPQKSSASVTAGNSCPSNSLSFANPGGAQTNHPDGWCFDASGNVLSKTSPPCPPNAPTYTWDAENRLVAYGASATYAYDGDGMRVQKNANGTSTVFVWSGSRDIAEYDFTSPQQPNPSAPSREFVYADGVPGNGLVASITGGTTTNYFHSDHLSTRLITDANGNDIGEQGHFPFGESWYTKNSASGEWVFTSYQRDSESGLDYALARYYDSTAARFCSADPLGGQPGDPQSWNRYAYARNNPITVTDPGGKGWLSWLLDAVIAAFTFLAPEFAPSLFSFWGETTTWTVTDQTAAVSANIAGGAALGGTALTGLTTGTLTLTSNISTIGLGGLEIPGEVMDKIPNGLDEARKNLSKKVKLNKRNCSDDLTKLGTNAEAVVKGISDAAVTNGVGSNVPISDLFKNATDPEAIAEGQEYAPGTTVGDVLNQKGVRAVSQLKGNSIFVSPSLFKGTDPFGNMATLLHEVLHNILGKTDKQIQNALGLKVQQKSENISTQLKKDCF
jgi:RHS repeat-associated protein